MWTAAGTPPRCTSTCTFRGGGLVVAITHCCCHHGQLTTLRISYSGTIQEVYISIQRQFNKIKIYTFSFYLFGRLGFPKEKK